MVAFPLGRSGWASVLCFSQRRVYIYKTYILMLKCTINNVIAGANTIIIVVVIIITLAGGGV